MEIKIAHDESAYTQLNTLYDTAQKGIQEFPPEVLAGFRMVDSFWFDLGCTLIHQGIDRDQVMRRNVQVQRDIKSTLFTYTLANTSIITVSWRWDRFICDVANSFRRDWTPDGKCFMGHPMCASPMEAVQECIEALLTIHSDLLVGLFRALEIMRPCSNVGVWKDEITRMVWEFNNRTTVGTVVAE